MVAPTISSISPSEGHTGGKYVVRIDGSDFQLPPAPPSTGFVGGSWTPSMRVEFDGELATDVRVFSDSILTCVAPAYLGDPAGIGSGVDVDVVVINLGPPEESTTEVDGFTYKRTNIARHDGIIRYVVRQLLLKMRREIINNIAITTSTDYDNSASDGLSFVYLAETPGIALFGPSLRENLDQMRKGRRTRQNVGALSYQKYLARKYEDFLFEANMMTSGGGAQNELLNLMQEFLMFFETNRYLEILSDSSDPNSEKRELELWLTGEPSTDDVITTKGTLAASASFEVRGVPVDRDQWRLIESGHMLDDPPDLRFQTEEVE